MNEFHFGCKTNTISHVYANLNLTFFGITESSDLDFFMISICFHLHIEVKLRGITASNSPYHPPRQGGTGDLE